MTKHPCLCSSTQDPKGRALFVGIGKHYNSVDHIWQLIAVEGSRQGIRSDMSNRVPKQQIFSNTWASSYATAASKELRYK
ncbi:hypothetical protein M431DRAFT_489661 [Trichoderma harzianum CBS 226.95]|uniref:Uncharacterized protein n=1 Tax=Trichoderma harzianum CBS 226.95 TaxID=983964 RepID=A0A2T4AUX8_TRIHA|nr:hypothetical protein M431DRAFT_489661 [Trichoderma harzianum CBS 226.95]PTB60873.1 hypothetical protein M431DRAFT_489661 [Trichoderma harzianum CBS 226.95]